MDGMRDCARRRGRRYKNNEDMEATVRKRRTTHPMSYYWSLVKDMDDSQKKELAIMIIESIKPAPAEPPMKRYTMDDINAMIDEAERQIAAGETIPDEEVWRKYDEELAFEEQEELELV